MFMAVAYSTEKSTAVNIYEVDAGSKWNGEPSLSINLQKTYKAFNFGLDSITISDIGYCDDTKSFLLGATNGKVYELAFESVQKTTDIPESELIV